ncbi:hypothetical protein CYMTET_5756 [Cymbomonas tetramitiformis]|uniref:SWIM-type domain-containing protein n=1 Tax=Cymbomonas tetramitiformis TaxID=36881 RepID=A0AAE0LJ33_9CHLO|nr:hypothetical protein CYMTET_5756 [Cymbomonas tetramitiformis]
MQWVYSKDADSRLACETAVFDWYSVHCSKPNQPRLNAYFVFQIRHAQHTLTQFRDNPENMTTATQQPLVCLAESAHAKWKAWGAYGATLLEAVEFDSLMQRGIPAADTHRPDKVTSDNGVSRKRPAGPPAEAVASKKAPPPASEGRPERDLILEVEEPRICKLGVRVAYEDVTPEEARGHIHDSEDECSARMRGGVTFRSIGKIFMTKKQAGFYDDMNKMVNTDPIYLTRVEKCGTHGPTMYDFTVKHLKTDGREYILQFGREYRCSCPCFREMVERPSPCKHFPWLYSEVFKIPHMVNVGYLHEPALLTSKVREILVGHLKEIRPCGLQ